MQEQSPSQKTLKVISIIDIVVGVLLFLMALLLIIGGAAASSSAAGADALDPETGAAVVVAGVVLLITAVLDFIVGILGLRAAKDNQKIMPVWVFAIISLALNVISFIVNVVKGSGGQNIVSQICSIVIAALVFWVANNIKKEAGK